MITLYFGGDTRGDADGHAPAARPRMAEAAFMTGSPKV